MEYDQRQAWLENAMNQWEAPLLRVCFAYLGDRALAEDAVQETFLKAWKNYSRFRGGSDEKTWLMRIAINTCKDVRKSAWFRHTDRSAALDALPPGSVPFTDGDDTVTRAVMALPEKLKQAALLRWFQDLSLDETAKALRLPRSTVYHRLQKAQSLLKDALEEWYHAD